jgi:hypothetical protein
MLAVDDGLANGNLDVADVLFLIATIIAVIAAVLSMRPAAGTRGVPSSALGWLAVALLAFGWFLL